MIENINKIDDDILREVSINKLSTETGVDKELIKSKIVAKKEIKVPLKEEKKTTPKKAETKSTTKKTTTTRKTTTSKKTTTKKTEK